MSMKEDKRRELRRRRALKSYKIGDLVLIISDDYDNHCTFGICKVTGFKKIRLKYPEGMRTIPCARMYTVAGFGKSRREQKGRSALHPLEDYFDLQRPVTKKNVQEVVSYLSEQLVKNKSDKNSKYFGRYYREHKKNLSSLKAYLEKNF